jgi:hypothetical protein
MDYVILQGEIERMIDAIDDEDIIKAMDEFVYLGFDRRQVIDRIFFKEPNQKQVAKDATFIITYLLLRGSKVAVKAFSKDGQDRLNGFMVKYAMRPVGSILMPRDITIPRFAACFPEIAAMILAKHPKMRDVVSPSVVSHEVCPPFLRFSSAASLLVAGTASANGHIEWAKAFYNIIIQKAPKEVVRKTPEQIASFAENIMTGDGYTKEQKEKFFQRFSGIYAANKDK